MSKKNLSIEDLNLSPREMEILLTGARAILPPVDPQENEPLQTLDLTGEEKTGP